MHGYPPTIGVGDACEASREVHASRLAPERESENERRTMNTYVILRRSGWRSPEDLQVAAERSGKVGDEEMSDEQIIVAAEITTKGGDFEELDHSLAAATA
jgi:hypothetical protein